MQVEYKNDIKGSSDQVFEYFSDFRKLPERLSAVTKTEVLTDGPTKLGTRFRETRKMFGKEHTEEMKVVEFTKTLEFMLEANSAGMRYLTKFRFEPKGDRTGVTVQFQGVPVSLMSKILSPLMAVMMKGTIKKCFEKDFQEFDDLVGK